ncbi:hypothetical protein L204_103813 [Cryptococcus depauperatus]
MATGCALPQEYAVYRQRRRYEALGAMTVGKRKIESLGGGGDDGEQGERYEKRGLSEPPVSEQRHPEVAVPPQRALTASATIPSGERTAESSPVSPSQCSPSHPVLDATQLASPEALSIHLSSLRSSTISTLKQSFLRRRSSFPSRSTPSGENCVSSWTSNSTPKASDFSFDALFGALGGGAGWTPGNGSWEQLLNNDTDIKSLATVPHSSNSAKDIQTPQPTSTSYRSQSQSITNKHDPSIQRIGEDVATSTPQKLRPPPFTSGKRNIQQTLDQEWKTALTSLVDVDGVGQIPVIKILQEVWKRGGGDSVTALCLWPSIVVALGTADAGPNARIPMASAESAMSLQQLYNLNIQHWEPSIFSGLLRMYAIGTMPQPPASQPMDKALQSQHYGPSTPMRDSDLSQWINLTPGAWSAQHDPFLGSVGQDTLFPSKLNKPPLPARLDDFPFPLEVSGRESTLEREERYWVKEPGDKAVVPGLDEMLAKMEQGQEERDQNIVKEIPPLHDLSSQDCIPSFRQSDHSVFHFLTSDTPALASPTTQNTKTTFSPPPSMTSPYVSAGSIVSNAHTVASGSSGKSCSKPRPTQLPMPQVDFIPPPPMCMFFNPSFESLTENKVGVWRGDLDVRGRGGGKFSVLMVGEKGTEHLWQSHRWPKKLAYPSKPTADFDCYTSTMIPVSHLAREGLVPITMGMVLCNEPAERIDPYVKMVHGLHAEGVAFHLPCDNPRLPIVFLPAKFHATDPLLRLGVAFLGKAGLPYPSAPLALPSHGHQSIGAIVQNATEEPHKKRRRQSAPPATGKARLRASTRKNSREKNVIQE